MKMAYVCYWSLTVVIEVCLLFNFATSRNGGQHFSTFCLFMGALPQNSVLLGGNTNTFELKTKAKFKDKRTSIATIRDPYRTYATLPTPLGSYYRLPSSVPDPDPPDPHVFGPPWSRSGSTCQRYGSFCHQAKIVRKPWFLLFCDFFMILSLKNDVNIPSKSKKQKTFLNKWVFCWRLEGQWRK